jgi:CubicO group peptidase (beta-lactamase class C family)
MAWTDPSDGSLRVEGSAPPGWRTLRIEFGSVTKGLTGFLLAELDRSGVVPVSSTLGRIFGHRIPRRWRATSLRELATHTSGMARIPLLSRLGLRAFLRHPDPYRQLTSSWVIRRLRWMPRRRAGRFRYSNFGYAVLGAALGTATGIGYQALLRKVVLEPLGMEDARFHGPPYGLVEGLDRSDRAVPPWTMTGFAAAGGLRGGFAELATVARAVAEPTRTELSRAIEDATRPCARVDEATRVGLGWMVTTGSIPIVWMNGGTGGHSTFVAARPTSGASIAAFTNRRHTSAFDRTVIARFDAVGLRS